jgi:hypothetical protein
MKSKSTQQKWLLMECGRRLYAHVIGLRSFGTVSPLRKQPKR